MLNVQIIVVGHLPCNIHTKTLIQHKMNAYKKITKIQILVDFMRIVLYLI